MNKHTVICELPDAAHVGRVTQWEHRRNAIVTIKLHNGSGWRVEDVFERLDGATRKMISSEIIRGKDCRSEAQASRIAKKWLAEGEAKALLRKKEQAALVRQKKQGEQTPITPPRCVAITQLDVGDTTKAKRRVLARQYPRTLALFARNTATLEDFTRAYQLDVAETFKLHDETVPGDPRHIAQLAAAFVAKFRGERKLKLDTVDMDIACNWLRGFCFLSAKELAARINERHGTTFKSGAIKKRRERLDLVSKHRPGPAENAP